MPWRILRITQRWTCDRLRLRVASIYVGSSQILTAACFLEKNQPRRAGFSFRFPDPELWYFSRSMLKYR